MKIIASMQAKNESDIIESVCRHTATFADKIIITENNSADNTKEIIQSLIQEGLPIEFLDSKIIMENMRKNNISYADFVTDFCFNNHDADLYMPIDADEFLFDCNEKNPREELCRLGQKQYYIIPWRTYIYEKQLTDNSKPIYEYFTRYRDPALEKFGKIVLSKYFWQQGAKRNAGNHTLLFPHGQTPPLAKTSLFYAHLPLRSSVQAMQKSILGVLSILAQERPADWGFHWKLLYKEIQKQGKANEKTLTWLTERYALPATSFEQEITTIEKILKNTYSEKIQLKYTNYEQYTKKEKLFIILTKGMEEIIQQLLTEKRDLKKELVDMITIIKRHKN